MSLNILFVLIIVGGWLSGKISDKLGLSAILGMTLWGVALSFFFKDTFPPVLWQSAPFLKSLALIVILLRAGLGIEKKVLQKIGAPSIRMAFIPCLFESTAVIIICRYLLHFSWTEAGMMGFILAAVSPAVVVPSMLTLKQQGYGSKNETPTLILAGVSVENVIAITIFMIFLNFSRGGHIDLMQGAISIPYAIISGLIFGICSGIFFSWLFKRYFKEIRATEKMLLLLGFSVLLLQLGSHIHIAALLSVMTMGFILLEKAETAAHEIASKLSKIWVFAEIVLFVLVGMSVNAETVIKAGLAGLIVIIFGILFRSLGVMLALFRTKFSLKERAFCLIAYIPKATVQAALGAIPLLSGARNGETILSIAVLSICLTAPIGLLGIKYFAPKLLDLELN